MIVVPERIIFDDFVDDFKVELMSVEEDASISAHRPDSVVDGRATVLAVGIPFALTMIRTIIPSTRKEKELVRIFGEEDVEQILSSVEEFIFVTTADVDEPLGVFEPTSGDRGEP